LYAAENKYDIFTVDWLLKAMYHRLSMADVHIILSRWEKMSPEGIIDEAFKMELLICAK
jgi:hypothetical protein